MTQYSFDTGEKKTFHTADYAVFGITLAISAFIGLYHAIRDRKRNTTDVYLLAGRGMHPFPVAMSLTATFISAITILGTPSEVYVHGTMYLWLCFGFIITATGAAHIFVPIFYNLGVTSVFQYMEMRFGKFMRVVTTCLYLLNMMFYMAIVLYTPSLALNAVTQLSLWGSIVVVGAVCIFYTALGGMKAVVWTDTLQMSIIYIGMLTLLIQGLVVLGGFGEAWDIADRGGRIVLTDFDPDPRVRHSVWTVMVGGGILWVANMGVNQASVQRAVSVRSVNNARIAIWLVVPGIAAILTLTCLVGVVMYAFYAHCDPLKAGLITRADQLMPLYMMDMLHKFHGLPGLLLSCVFSGCLSTVSSSLNAISAVLLEDFAKPFCCSKIPPQRATLLSKCFVVVGGVLGLLLAFVVSEIGAMVLQLTYILFGVLTGPMLGIFTLGILFPWANTKGSIAGYFTSLALMMWIGLGARFTKTSTARLPATSTEGCFMNSSLAVTDSLVPNITLVPEDRSLVFENLSGLQNLYALSYFWYVTVATTVTVVVGLIVSFATGPTDPVTLNPKLICPVFDVLCPYLPEKIRKSLRFGVRHGEFDDEEILTDEDTRKSKLENLTGMDDAVGENPLVDITHAIQLDDLNHCDKSHIVDSEP